MNLFVFFLYLATPQIVFVYFISRKNVLLAIITAAAPFLFFSYTKYSLLLNYWLAFTSVLLIVTFFLKYVVKEKNDFLYQEPENASLDEQLKDIPLNYEMNPEQWLEPNMSREQRNKIRAQSAQQSQSKFGPLFKWSALLIVIYVSLFVYIMWGLAQMYQR